MDTEKTTETGVETEEKDGEDGGQELATENITLSRKEYDQMVQTTGSLKKQLKEMKKSQEELQEKTSEKTNPDESNLLSKAYLRAAGITDAEEVDLALATSEKWGQKVDKLVDDPDWQAKLERHRKQKSNELATSDIKGGGGKTESAKSTPEYWIAKGRPPMPNEVADRKTRVKIANAMRGGASGKTFYND